MEILQQVLENTQLPIVTALILGLMTAISPCPLASNITAIGYLSKDLSNRKKVFIQGIVYTLGRAISYTAIGLLFYFGANQFSISSFLQQYGEKIIGPLLIVVGIFMLGIININFSFTGKITGKIDQNKPGGYGGALLLGVLFALAFCPYSGVLYFGMLIPITVSSIKGLYLPVVFALATGLPVIIIAWLLAYSVSGIGKFYNRIKAFEFWFRRIIAIVFIGIGIYYTVTTLII
ncbi:MAG: aromatic aminobenezylarsenical efflux permease ArsG family transporter [Bacteroidales bacterium]|nr:aromatic aminobenezylarsenical efflux permease ArsG family transporter [Bacteroidales bacterium]